jgi:acetate kinase
MNDDSRHVLLALNVGSSSLKFAVYNANVQAWSGPQCLGSGSVCGQGQSERLVFACAGSQIQQQEQWSRGEALQDHGTVRQLMDWIERQVGWNICAVVHRVVHGGNRSQVAARVDTALIDEMQALTPMAPLHQPLCLAPIKYLAGEHRDVPQFACFDTAFHHTLAWRDTCFGLPRALTEQGLRRYGFHGLSYEYIASVLPHYDSAAANGRTIVAHLGNGASLCALDKSVSRATTMGFSTLDGLLMGTRPGRLDPGIVLYLQRERGMSASSVEHLLYHECGLLGVCGGISSDMRVLLDSQAPEAKEAIGLFVHCVVREIGALAAVLGGVDALVFTGGIGEHAAQVRQAILDGCRWLGVQPSLDEVNPRRGCLSAPGSAVSAWTISTDENLVMARHALRLLNPPT